MRNDLKLAVFISGGGTNLQAILDACQHPDFPATTVAVVSNVAQAYGLCRAKEAGVPTLCVPHREYASREEHEAVLIQKLAPFAPDLIVLAGYMRVVTSRLIDAFYNKQDGLPGVINIHPADTKAYQGAYGYEFALGLLPGSKRLSQTKITVHFVDKGVDTGPVIRQAVVPIYEDDDLDRLRARGLAIEHQLYPEVIRLLALRRLRLLDGMLEIADGPADADSCVS